MSNRRDVRQKRIVKFVPTEDQRRTKVKEWQKITPELSALLQRLDDKVAANAFIKKYGKRLSRLPNTLIVYYSVVTARITRLVIFLPSTLWSTIYGRT